MNRFFIIDGHALVFKMYYALLGRRPMKTSSGEDTSILFGFTKYVLELLQRESPTHFAVSFDPPGGTFRNTMYPEYKANRDATPQLVIDSLEPLKEICAALNIPVVMVPGYEADDVIGTVAKANGSPETQVYMVTPDKDYGQLVDGNIFQVKPGKAGEGDEILDEKRICEKWGINRTDQVIEVLTLCGDSADNVPGVKGVGEKGASKLLLKYGTVKEIYSHLDELSAKQKAMFEEAKDHIALSHELVTIKTDVPMDTTLSLFETDRNYGNAAKELFAKYEFHSLTRFLSSGDEKKKEEEKVSLDIVVEDALKVCSLAKESGRVSISVNAEGNGIFAPVRSVSVCAVSDDGKFLCATGEAEDFKGILQDEGVEKVGEDLKRQISWLKDEGVEVKGKLLDVPLMHYLIDPERSHKVDSLSASMLGIVLGEIKEGTTQGNLFEMPEDGADQKENECHQRLAVLLLLCKKVRSLMEKTDPHLSKLYDTMEEPLLRVLSEMERQGVKVDVGQLKAYTEGLRKETAALEKEVRDLSGKPTLNVSSPKQVGEVLFDDLKLDPKAKKGKNGAYSTDEPTLMAIYDRHPIIGKILEYRGAKKLLSTYIEPFPQYISPVDGKVHTTFNQALTSTGRLSSSNPNLQNIPVREERGREIRKAFVPSTPDGLILSADYSQIELRLMAHLCGDAHLVQAFNNGEDIHAATASKIFGIPTDEVTREQRSRAKTANFGIMYGISAFGLSQRLRIPRGEAKQLIDDYFAAFPAIKSFIENTLSSARAAGYVETLFGRRRYIPDINSHNGTVRQMAERNAVNAPIQGTAADIIKLAMIAVDREIRSEGLQSKMILQVHDELLFDTFPSEVQALGKIVKTQMESVAKLSVPLTVECNYGKNWLEAH